MSDPEYESLKTRHLLPVLNHSEPTDSFTLEGPGETPSGGPPNDEILRNDIVDVLKTVYDPEIPLNIYDLGLIYSIDIAADRSVKLEMTLTAPGCPVAGSLVTEVHERVRTLPGIKQLRTELVWEPAWTKERLTDEAKLALGLL